MWRHKITSYILMTCGNTSDFIDHPLPRQFVSAHGASHHVWAPGPPPSKSGADYHRLAASTKFSWRRE